MTRTERSVNPRAVIRDRSESKSGLDKSLPKNGAGPYNWGSYADEQELEAAALADEEQELAAEEDTSNASVKSDDSNDKKLDSVRTTSGPTQEEVEKARQFRKHALKAQGVDLAAIARTSAAVATSPPKSSPVPPRTPSV